MARLGAPKTAASILSRGIASTSFVECAAHDMHHDDSATTTNRLPTGPRKRVWTSPTGASTRIRLLKSVMSPFFCLALSPGLSVVFERGVGASAWDSPEAKCSSQVGQGRCGTQTDTLRGLRTRRGRSPRRAGRRERGGPPAVCRSRSRHSAPRANGDSGQKRIDHCGRGLLRSTLISREGMGRSAKSVLRAREQVQRSETGLGRGRLGVREHNGAMGRLLPA